MKPLIESQANTKEPSSTFATSPALVAARDVDNNSLTIPLSLTIRSFVTATISARFCPQQTRINHLAVRCSYLCTNYQRSRLLKMFDEKALASMAVNDSTKTHRVTGKGHCSFHFSLKITLYGKDFQKNKLLETEYNVAAVLRNNPMIALQT